jgi:exodeoxyribonuclease V beta subunit
MEQFLALKASAGSGKTFTLTVRYISLLFLDVAPNTILTLTFTNKAALEMSERIFNTLINLGNDKVILDFISNETLLSIEEILAKKDSIIKTFLSTELSIFTLDKFMNKILREFSGYIDISDDFSIENDDHDLMLYKFLISLNEEQFDKLIHFSYDNDKKLNSLIELFMLLDEKNENFNQYDFSKHLLDSIIDNILLSANKIAKHILNSNASNSAKKAVTFSSIEELLQVGKTWLTKDSLIEYSYFKKANPTPELDNELEAIKNDLSLYYRYKEIGILNGIFAIYNNFKEFRLNYKKEKNSLEFNDITNLVYKLLEKYIDKDFLYFRLDTKYDHMLIDEFQDTSVLQYKILEPLISEILAGYSEKYKTFFYVGDTKQSIYRFRGGKKELFDYVIEKNKEQVKLQILETNYRSSQNVVNYVNEIFTVQKNYEYYPQKVNSELDGYISVEKIDEESEDKYLFIKKKLDILFEKGIDPHNIAILTYTNADVLEIYEYLKNEYKDLKIITDMTSKLINQNNVKAIINLVKYYYFKEKLYQTSFNALMGFDLNQDIELNINIKNNALETIVKQITDYYQLMEENVIKFIEMISKYKDIVDFIYEIDNDDSVMINKENTGLQILTIFKSKGLEFDTVLVVDRLKKKNIDRSSLLFSYDKIDLRRVYYKNKIREEFDAEYKNSVDKEKRLSLDDELNILYVALTRAKNNLIIFKKEKQSVFDLLHYSMKYTELGRLHIKQKDLSQKVVENINYTPLHLGTQEVQKKDKIDDVDNLKARYFGIATHYCLEMMNRFDKESLDFSIELTISKYANLLGKNDFDDIYNRIEMLVDSNQFQNILEQSDYSKEQELIYNNELKIIDLLVENENEYTIIDYKTTHSKQDSHLEQVQNYKDAIKDITSKDVKSYVVYLKKEKVEFILV